MREIYRMLNKKVNKKICASFFNRKTALQGIGMTFCLTTVAALYYEK